MIRTQLANCMELQNFCMESSWICFLLQYVEGLPTETRKVTLSTPHDLSTAVAVAAYTKSQIGDLVTMCYI